MKISPVNFFNPQNVKAPSRQRANNAQNNLECDTFVKSNVSFKGGAEDNLFSDFFDGLAFLAIVSEAASMMDEIYEDIEHEADFEAYLEVMGSKSAKNAIMKSKLLKIEDFNKRRLDGCSIDMEHINSLLDEAGIVYFTQLNAFLRQLNGNKDTKQAFDKQEMEAAKIYGKLEDKNYLSKYGELLLYLYNSENDKEEPDFSKLNTRCEFLEKLGVSDFSSFDKKFSHLKSRFGDFYGVEDKADAIEYLMQTYDKKISLLDETLANCPDIKKDSAAELYKNHAGIVDYLFEQNGGKSLGDLHSYADTLLEAPKIKQQVFSFYSMLFNDFETPEDVIEFYKTVKSCKCHAFELNAFASKPYIEGSDPLDYLAEFEELSSFIKDGAHISSDEARKIYINFKDALVALNKDDNKQPVLDFVDITKKLKIKNSQNLPELYNKAFGTKKKTLTKEELKEFVELFNNAESNAVFEEAKRQKTPVKELLRAKQERRELYEGALVEFLKQDESGYFAGRSAQDIYREYSGKIKDDTNVEDFIADISALKTENPAEYEQKSAVLNMFSDFFDDRKSLLNFIAKTGIKLDATDEDTARIQDYITVLGILSSGSNYDTAKERLNYAASSNFLTKPKDSVKEFLQNNPNLNLRSEILRLAADKKANSLNDINKFYKNYKGEKTGTSNLTKFLHSLPSDMTFDEAYHIITFLQGNLDKANLPFKINGDNILNVDMEYFSKTKKFSAASLNKLATSLNGQKEGVNFVSALPNALLDKPSEFSNFRIAREIVSKVDKTDESYKNLTEKLKLTKKDLKLDENCSDYLYTRAVEKVLPKELTSFLNSTDWQELQINGQKKFPNLLLHAKLRLIDRFALAGGSSLEGLNSPETKEKLHGIIKSIYTSSPDCVWGTDKTKRIVADINSVETVISNTGEIITIVPTAHYPIKQI